MFLSSLTLLPSVRWDAPPLSRGSTDRPSLGLPIDCFETVHSRSFLVHNNTPSPRSLISEVWTMANQWSPLPNVERLSSLVIRILGGNPSKFTLQGIVYLIVKDEQADFVKEPTHTSLARVPIGFSSTQGKASHHGCDICPRYSRLKMLRYRRPFSRIGTPIMWVASEIFALSALRFRSINVAS